MESILPNDKGSFIPGGKKYVWYKGGQVVGWGCLILQNNSIKK